MSGFPSVPPDRFLFRMWRSGTGRDDDASRVPRDPVEAERTGVDGVATGMVFARLAVKHVEDVR